MRLLKVVVYGFNLLAWSLILAAILDEAAERIKVSRQTERQIRAYNESISHMERTLREVRR